MASLRDWLGNIIKSKLLSESIATADRARGRDPQSGHAADFMTPVKLTRILKAAADGDPLAYFELAEDIEERDPHYTAVLGTRKRAVAQLPITVKAASDSAAHKQHADLVQQWLDRQILQASLFDMLDAIGKGISVLEVDWQARGNILLPAALMWRPMRWFVLDDSDGETLMLRDGVHREPMAEHKFIIHRHKAKSGLTIRSGVARIAAWSWMFKSFTIKDWAIFCQNFGQPIRIGKYGRGATEAEKDILWRAVSNIAGDCAAIVPLDMLIEFHEVGSKGSSTDMYERRADWHDRTISKLILGQTTTTDAVSGGHAVAQEHRLVQEDIERADATMATATLNGQLVPNIVAFNFGPQDVYPKIRIGRPDEVPLEIFSKSFAELAPYGLTAEMSYMRDRLGIPTPKADAELVGGQQATATGAAGANSATVAADQKPRPEKAVQHLFNDLFKTARQNRTTPDALIETLTERLEDDAADALDGMIDEVRAAIMSATSLSDAAERLAALDLNADALADAMARGMALSHLAGQAALIDDLQGRS
ncbi:DUF935 domain-containing protein [Rhizobium sp. CFBP 8762]|uniref:DUF935 domain-containing protein n=1 Tax=Rhizobium sp. CFBP 8762 TaxID=2775279 RepID=UPI00178202DC|nr:DUF935 domain-containing protein [Rhizobium sp. CFBP 8762]MBD8554908.1 DUF935 domain-containing protein [Rhizobium sp. CFBP 8762]